MNCFLDIETAPCQTPDILGDYIEASRQDFKPPSSMTKSQLGTDLGMSEKEYKFISAGDLKLAWCDRFRDEKAAEVGEENWRKTALSGDTGEIISIAWAVDDNPVQCSYRKQGEPELDVIGNAFAIIDHEMGPTGGKRTPVWCGHNIIGFDIPFLYRRCVINNIKPLVKIPVGERHGSKVYDTMIAWAGFGKTISQDNLCGLLGLELKPDGIDGSMVYDAWRDGEHDRIMAYNKYDSETVRRIFKRLNFMEVDA